jgi:hypothetical protein
VSSAQKGKHEQNQHQQIVKNARLERTPINSVYQAARIVHLVVTVTQLLAKL